LALTRETTRARHMTSKKALERRRVLPKFLPSTKGSAAAHSSGKQLLLPSQLVTWLSNLDVAMGDKSDFLSPLSKSKTAGHKAKPDCVIYILSLDTDAMLIIETVLCVKHRGGVLKRRHIADLEQIAYVGIDFADQVDRTIACLILSVKSNVGRFDHYALPEIPELSRILVTKMVSTGRCYWKSFSNDPLSLAPPKKGRFTWKADKKGKQSLKVAADEGTVVGLGGGAWYIEPETCVIGALEMPVPDGALRTILSAPGIEPAQVATFSNALSRLTKDIPPPVAAYEAESILVESKPVLNLIMLVQDRYYSSKAAPPEAYGIVTFDYGKVKFKSRTSAEVKMVEDDKITIYKRDLAREASLIDRLFDFGMVAVPNGTAATAQNILKLKPNSDSKWFSFMANDLPVLEREGWAIDIDRFFNYQVVVPEQEWSADATSGSDYWFALDLGITIDGKSVPLLPILHEALKTIVGKDPLAEFETLNCDGIFYAPLKDGRHVALPFERVKAIVTVLLELFDRSDVAFSRSAEISLPQLMELSSTLALSGTAQSSAFNSTFNSTLNSPLNSTPNSALNSAFDSAQKIGLTPVANSWAVGKKLQALMDKVKSFEGLKVVSPPQSLKAELRPYQLEGLSWLEFLREFGLGGILADDMGLGKTVQTLAHIAREKEENRLNKPFLVVCPTSVLPNWLSEIDKFTPHLKVTALHGPARSEHFAKIAKSDIVLTTYPLVARDDEALCKQKWKAVILDEAQMIKNPTTLAAQALCRLRSEYRVCLTGTPIENHLGELWSQFNFLMPGFLKDLKTFTKKLRTPIEKQNNVFLQKVLASKVRPFLLRRTKELVASELPAKTIITKSIELDGRQRDLYETVRLAMYEKVKEAVANKGLAKSQIIVLDALLKLRQVCCDPRLVSLASAKKVSQSVKLELLLDMIEELMDEGKSILLFSQFTSMLDLIMPELNKRAIEFVQIRGDTKDRRTPVESFQSGKVRLFLLSLKAGGTGLNLTAADTVIHYDPWWNPAVENQATDRAHRIGQKKAVFVFKLIASGTIEERMVELQERKKAIAEGMYGDENALPSQLTSEDLESLFAPLSSGDEVPKLPSVTSKTMQSKKEIAKKTPPKKAPLKI
jgi:superfamily II DNA or RNA helicase